MPEGWIKTTPTKPWRPITPVVMTWESLFQEHEPKAYPVSSAARSAPDQHRLLAVLERHAAVTHLTQPRPGFAFPDLSMRPGGSVAKLRCCRFAPPFGQPVGWLSPPGRLTPD